MSRTILKGVIALIVLVGAACSSGSNDDGSAAPTGDSPAPQSASQTPEPAVSTEAALSAADEGAQGALADAILSILVSDPQRPGFPTDEELGCLANGVAGAFADDRISQLGLDEASLSSAYADSGSLLLGDRFGASPSEIENLLDKALACTDWRRVLAVTMERDGASAEQAACFSSETSDEGLRAQVGGLLVSTEGLLDGSGEQVGQEFVRLMSVCLDFRMLMYDSLVQGSGISEESAQCVVDNMSDELVDGYFEAISAGEEAVMAAIIAELTDIQGRCLTPEEFQMMGGFGAGDDDFAEATDFQSNECPPADGSGPTVLDFAGPQPMCLDPAKQYTAVFNTTAGQMRVALDMANTPITANNFAVLAQYHYYDDTLLFRTDPSIGIIQGGAPHTNSPSDPGPGYTIADEGSGFAYEPGQIVMARTGAPNSASAQFFFAVNENTALLNSQGTYVVFGQMDNDSLAVAEAILASHVDEPDNPLGGGPEPPVTVNSVTIEETG